MDKKEKTRQFLAGLFFATGMIFTVIFVFTIGRDKGFSQPKYQIAVLFRNVGGLTESASIHLSGVTIGNVASIDFLERPVEGRNVKVLMNIFKKYQKKLDKSVNFAIKTEGVLGEKYIEITVVPSARAMDWQKPIFGEDPLDVENVAQSFAHAAEAFTRMGDQLSQIDIKEFVDLTSESQRTLNTLGKRMNGLMDDFGEISHKSRRVLDRVEQKLIDGTLFKVF